MTVEVTYHALDRFEQRLPHLHRSRGEARRFIEAEVADAFEDRQRVKKKTPRFVQTAKGLDHLIRRKERNRRYAYTENREAVFVCEVKGHEVTVLTVLPGVTPKPVAPPAPKVKHRPWFTRADLDKFFMVGPTEPPQRPRKTTSSKWKRRRQHIAHESRRVNFRRAK